MKKFIGWVIIILLFAGSVCGIVFGIRYIQNKNYIENNIGTLEEIEELKDQIDDYQFDIASLTEQLTVALNQNVVDAGTIESLNIELKNVKDELESKKIELEAIKNNLNESNTQIESLTTSLAQTQSELEATILELEEVTVSLNNALAQSELDQETISNLTSQVEDLSSQNESLSSQVINLNNQILELQAQLEVYEGMDLDNCYKLTFINDSNDAIVSTSYIKKNKIFNYPPTILNTYDYWFYGWAQTEESEELFDFEDFLVDKDYTFYSVLSNNVDLKINSDNSMFVYEDNEAAEGSSAHLRSAIYRYGENLTVADLLKIDDNIVLKGIEEGTINYKFDDNVTLNTKLKDLPNEAAVMKISGGGSYTWNYKILNCNLILSYTDPYTNIVSVKSEFNRNDKSYAYIELYLRNCPRLNILSATNINLNIVYKGENINTTISGLSNSYYEQVVVDKGYYGVKITPFSDKNIELYFEMKLNGVNEIVFRIIDPNKEDGYVEATVNYSLNVELDKEYISYLSGLKNHEFWYYSNATIEE